MSGNLSPKDVEALKRKYLEGLAALELLQQIGVVQPPLQPTQPQSTVAHPTAAQRSSKAAPNAVAPSVSQDAYRPHVYRQAAHLNSSAGPSQMPGEREGILARQAMGSHPTVLSAAQNSRHVNGNGTNNASVALQPQYAASMSSHQGVFQAQQIYDVQQTAAGTLPYSQELQRGPQGRFQQYQSVQQHQVIHNPPLPRVAQSEAVQQPQSGQHHQAQTGRSAISSAPTSAPSLHQSGTITRPSHAANNSRPDRFQSSAQRPPPPPSPPVPQLTIPQIQAMRAFIENWHKGLSIPNAFFHFEPVFGWGRGLKVVKALNGIYVEGANRQQITVDDFLKRLEANAAPEPNTIVIPQAPQLSATPRNNGIAYPQQMPPAASVNRTNRVPSSATNPSGPTATPPAQSVTTQIRSPAQANKYSMAKDVLHALGKRVRVNSDIGFGPLSKRVAKISAWDPHHQPSPSPPPSTFTSTFALKPPPTDIPVHNAIPPPATATVASGLSSNTESEKMIAEEKVTPEPPQPVVSRQGAIGDIRISEVPNDQVPQSTPPLPPYTPHDASSSKLDGQRLQNEPDPKSPSFKTGASINSILNTPSPRKTDIQPVRYTPEPSSPKVASNKGGNRSDSPIIIDMTTPTPTAARSATSGIVIHSTPSSSKQKDTSSSSPIPLNNTPPPPTSPSSEGEPLFLPSTTTSRASTPMSIIDLTGPSPRKKIRNRAYVLIPPPPPHVVQYRRLQEQHTRRTKAKGKSKADDIPEKRKVGRPPKSREPSIPSSVDGEEAEADYYAFDAEGNRIEDSDERDIMEIACTRLISLPCKWYRCDVVMNSVTGLRKHLEKGHRPPLKKGQPFSCLWTQCGKQCHFGDYHLMKHAYDFLVCPYDGCDDNFRTVTSLCRHTATHDVSEAFKPPWIPFSPSELQGPPPVPAVVPTYLAGTLSVQPASIPRERHEVLGPWVELRIAGLKKWRRDGRRRLKTQRNIGDDESQVDEEATRRYEYLTDYPARYSSIQSEPVENIRFDPLSSEEVTGAVRQGMVILEDRPPSPRPPSTSPEPTDFRDLSPLVAAPAVVPGVPTWRPLGTASVPTTDDEGEVDELLLQSPRGPIHLKTTF